MEKNNVGSREGRNKVTSPSLLLGLASFPLCSISLHVISFVSVCPLPLRVMSHQFDPQSTSSFFSSIRFGTFLLLLFPTFWHPQGKGGRRRVEPSLPCLKVQLVLSTAFSLLRTPPALFPPPTYLRKLPRAVFPMQVLHTPPRLSAVGKRCQVYRQFCSAKQCGGETQCKRNLEVPKSAGTFFFEESVCVLAFFLSALYLSGFL